VNSLNPVLIDLGFLQITWYSLFILLGVMIASFLVLKEGKKFGLTEDYVVNLMFWTVIFGIIGARLFYVIFNWNYYSHNVVEIFKIWNGGLSIHGAIIFGLMVVLLYSKKYEFRFLKMTDITVVGLIIAQAIGRWGNFFNSEAHGWEVSRRFLEKLHLPEFIINGMNINGTYYHPTFLYESLWCLIGFIVLLLIRKFNKYLKTGQLTGIYLAWYGVGRFFIEILRTDSLMLGPLKFAQVISVIMVIAGILLIIFSKGNSMFDNKYQEKEIIDDVKF